MKCWTRYMLPLVMALCLFLGSSFYSQASEAQETSGNMIDYGACITECTGLANDVTRFYGDTFYYLGSFCGDCIYLVFSSSPIVVYDRSVPQSIGVQGYDLRFYSVTANFSSYSLLSFRSGLYNSGSSFNMSTAFSNHDIFYRDSGELFFHQPSPFQRAVQAQDWTAVMMEIVTILPLLIVSLTSLIGLRKGLRFISTLLHQA